MIEKWSDVASLFTATYFAKPVILVIDKFEALAEDFINCFANEFRDMYLTRANEVGTLSEEKKNLLHGLTLIGVRSVLGIENVSGSPFNVQRSVHISNLTQAEVTQIYQDYQDESGQRIEQAVVVQIYDEFRGQPGLTCWFGELLTEKYNRHDGEITVNDFEDVYSGSSFTRVLNTSSPVTPLSRLPIRMAQTVPAGAPSGQGPLPSASCHSVSGCWTGFSPLCAACIVGSSIIPLPSRTKMAFSGTTTKITT